MISRLAQRRRKRLTIFVGVVFATCVVLFVLVLWFFNSSLFRITSVEVSGENVVPASSLEQAVQHDLLGRYGGLFARNNIFLYPKDGISKNLLALYPTLKTVHVNAKNFHTITIVVDERTPAALWCGTERVGVGEECILLDAQGLAYANAPHYSGTVYQTYYGAITEGPLPKQFLTPEVFRSLFALVETFQKKNTPDTVEYIAVDTNNDVRVAFSGGYDILFALKEDSGALFDRFSLTLTAAPFTTHSLSDFEYVDLRFGDKVYYRLKNQ